MAATVPHRTYTSGELMTAALANTYWRDNQNHLLSDHDHDGDAGDGAKLQIASSSTPATIVNTTAETSLFSATIPGGSLAGGNIIEVMAWGTYLNNAGSSSLTWHIDFGSTEILTNVGTSGSNAAVRPWSIKAYLWETAANTQSAWMRYISIFSGETWSNTANNDPIADTGTAAETSSGALTFDFRVVHGVASVNQTITVQGYSFLAAVVP